MNNKKRKIIIIGLLVILIMIIVFIIGYKVVENNKKNNNIQNSKDLEIQAVLGVSLTENGELVVDNSNNGDETQELEGTLLTKTFNEEFKIGKTYSERLAVKNTGTVDMYIRVIIYKCYFDKEGNKTIDISPETIKLNLINNDSWLLDTELPIPERETLYYKYPLESGNTTLEFMDTISVGSEVYNLKETTRTTSTEGYETIKTTYNCNDHDFSIDVQVDCVQRHNAADAMWSSWGVSPIINSDGVIEGFRDPPETEQTNS
ncbi:MAG: hypothetical protein HFJ55_00655 [Clostridia bacterium]|nr:hypothetical protein [Clostridia bacterium]